MTITSAAPRTPPPEVQPRNNYKQVSDDRAVQARELRSRDLADRAEATAELRRPAPSQERVRNADSADRSADRPGIYSRTRSRPEPPEADSRNDVSTDQARRAYSSRSQKGSQLSVRA